MNNYYYSYSVIHELTVCVCVCVCGYALMPSFYHNYYVCIVPHVTSLYIAFETDCDDYYDVMATLHVYMYCR